MSRLLHNYTTNGSSTTDEYGTHLILNRMISGEVAEGFDVVANGTPNMTVKVNPGSGRIPTGTYPASYGYLVSHDTAGGESVTIPTAAASPRKDYIVGYVDKSVAGSTNPSYVNNSNNIFKFAAVAGTPAASPVSPTTGQIQTAIGAANPYFILAELLVGAGVSAVTNVNITDKRVMASARLADGAVTAGKTDLSSFIKASSTFQNNTVISTVATKYEEIAFRAPKVRVGFEITVRDGVSGAARTGQAWIYRDGVVISGSNQFIWQTIFSGQYSSSCVGSIVRAEPDGNSHTYALYIGADVASATLITNTSLRVEAVT